MNKEIGVKRQKRIPYWAALIIWVAVTCVSANTLTLVFQFGGFTPWRSLPKPPSGAVHIIDADGLSVWVETGDGNLYTLTLYCGASENCFQWIRIDKAEEIHPFQCRPIERGPDCASIGGSLWPNDPVPGKVGECIVADACIPDPEFGSLTYFAMMSDGSVKYWQHGAGLLGFQVFFIASTIALPILVAIVVSIVYLIKYIIRKRQKAG